MDADHRVKSPKHRLTCDNCKKSKVRCSQDRPVCSRCSRQSVECNYSLSRRAGRPRLNRSFSKHTPQRATQLASRSSLQPGPSSSPKTANSNANVSTNTDSTASTDASVDGTDTSTDTGTNTTALTSIGTETETADVELPSLSLAGLELQWDVPTSAFDFPPLDTTTTPGVFSWNLDTIFASEAPNTQPDGGLDSIGADPRPAEESACSCAAELLDCLFQVSAELGAAEDGASRVLRAITASRRVLDVCQTVLCCSRCVARWSTTLLLCQAADQIALALDLGSVWTDSASPRYYLQADGLARENVLLRFGNYTVNGANRRLVLRSMLVRRLISLQEVMDMARCAIDALDLGAITPCEKTLVGLVTEVVGVVSSKVDLVSTSL